MKLSSGTLATVAGSCWRRRRRAAPRTSRTTTTRTCRFRGFGPEWGYIWPSRVEPTQSFGLRMDLGYLGPGLRIVPGITYWKSDFKAGEIRELEDRVASLIVAQTGEPAAHGGPGTDRLERRRARPWMARSSGAYPTTC